MKQKKPNKPIRDFPKPEGVTKQPVRRHWDGKFVGEDY